MAIQPQTSALKNVISQQILLTMQIIKQEIVNKLALWAHLESILQHQTMSQHANMTALLPLLPEIVIGYVLMTVVPVSMVTH